MIFMEADDSAGLKGMSHLAGMPEDERVPLTARSRSSRRFPTNNNITTMPNAWQITQKRALQTQGVWALVDDFILRGKSKDDHADLASGFADAAAATEDAKNLLDTADGTLGSEYEYLRSMNVAIGSRLDGEVPDDEPLQKDIDQVRGLTQSSRAKIEDRAMKTAAAWKKIDAARSADTPPLDPITVRGATAAQFRARWEGLPTLRTSREEAAAGWREQNSIMERQRRVLDRLNKDWYEAWKSEYPPGTPEGDALAGVDTEQSTPPPEILEIAAAVQTGLSLTVIYVPDIGDHATVLDLQWLVEGVHGDWQRVTVVPEGNVIGPFEVGQIVRVRTDVGNSRDFSELSPEMVVTIQPKA